MALSFTTLCQPTVLKGWQKKKTKEILHQKVSCVPRPPPNIILMAAWQVQRDDSHQRGSSMGEPLADEAKKELKN